jgi:hypothetical protein
MLMLFQSRWKAGSLLFIVAASGCAKTLTYIVVMMAATSGNLEECSCLAYYLE